MRACWIADTAAIAGGARQHRYVQVGRPHARLLAKFGFDVQHSAEIALMFVVPQPPCASVDGGFGFVRRTCCDLSPCL